MIDDLKNKIEDKLSVDMLCLIADKRRSNAFKEIQQEVYICVRKNTVIPLWHRLNEVYLWGWVK